TQIEAPHAGKGARRPASSLDKLEIQPHCRQSLYKLLKTAGELVQARANSHTVIRACTQVPLKQPHGNSSLYELTSNSRPVIRDCTISFILVFIWKILYKLARSAGDLALLPHAPRPTADLIRPTSRSRGSRGRAGAGARAHRR